MKKILIILLILLLAVPICISAGQRIVVTANSIDYEHAADFIDSLDKKGRPVLRITAQELDAHNQEKFIIILGGPDAPEGIGIQVQELLSEKDMEFLREKRGNKKMFVKTNIWRKGQVVMIFAGNNRNDTKKSAKDNEPKVHEEATEERVEQLAENTANVEFNIEDFNYSINKSSGYWFFHWVEYSMSNKDTATINPMLDVELLRKDGQYKQYFINTDVTNFEEEFKPNSNWFDTYSEEVKLDPGKYKLIVRLRDGADSTVIKQDMEEFQI